jgi:hypothetical protein
MTIIRVEFAPDFRGEDVVLLAMDAAGVVTFAAALKDAAVRGTSQLQHGGVTHEFLIQADAADIKLDDIRVVWRLDPLKAVEIIEDLDELSSGDRPGHHYVDISNPTQTLVVSRDEYVRQS